AMAFMALFAIIIAERIDYRAGMILLVPLVALGAGSVIYWHWTETIEQGDLRLYQHLHQRAVGVKLESHQRDHRAACRAGFGNGPLEARRFGGLALPLEERHPRAVGHRFHRIQRRLDDGEGSRRRPEQDGGDREDRLVGLELQALLVVLRKAALLYNPAELGEGVEICIVPRADVLALRDAFVRRELCQQQAIDDDLALLGLEAGDER